MPLKSLQFPQKERLPRWLFTINKFWILTLFLGLLGALSLQDSSKAITPISSDILYRCTNAVREENNVQKLTLNQQLQEAAELKLHDMEKYGYWAHQNPTTGKQPWEFIDETGYYYKTAGENLAIGYQLSEEICDAWQKSPSHFENLINPKFQEVGFAEQKVELNSHQSGVLVVQMFGTRADFEKEKLTREKCSKRIKDDMLVLYPTCGTVENEDPVTIIFNPKGYDLIIKLDGKEVTASLTTYGDYYRYEFSKPFAPGSHQLEISTKESPLQAAHLRFMVTEEQEKNISQNISESLTASIISGQNTSEFAAAIFILAISSLVYLLRDRIRN